MYTDLYHKFVKKMETFTLNVNASMGKSICFIALSIPKIFIKLSMLIMSIGRIKF